MSNCQLRLTYAQVASFLVGEKQCQIVCKFNEGIFFLVSSFEFFQKEITFFFFLVIISL